jgi:hypothetical protein
MPKPIPKDVSSELVFDGAPQSRARLPLRVQIYQDDSTKSILTTVKVPRALGNPPWTSPLLMEMEAGGWFGIL